MRAFMKANKLAGDAAGGAVVNNAMARAPSPAVVMTVKAKEARYKVLCELLENQFKTRRREVLPKLVSAVITHLGELGPDLIDLVEVLTSVAGKLFVVSPLTMGVSRAKYTAQFRTKLKDELLTANALGFGRALVAAGNPMSGWIMSPGEDGDEMPDWDCPY